MPISSCLGEPRATVKAGDSWYNGRAMMERLGDSLRGRRKRKITDRAVRRSAVLIPLLQEHGQYHVLLTKRSDEVEFHKGEVCLPGGRCEPDDTSLLRTALRETEEEIGLDPEDVEILGELDDILTLGSNYVISPFVGYVPHPRPLKADPREIQEIITVPVSFLLDDANFREDAYAYEYEGRVIWGATARILRQLVEVLSGESGTG